MYEIKLSPSYISMYLCLQLANLSCFSCKHLPYGYNVNFIRSPVIIRSISLGHQLDHWDLAWESSLSLFFIGPTTGNRESVKATEFKSGKNPLALMGNMQVHRDSTLCTTEHRKRMFYSRESIFEPLIPDDTLSLPSCSIRLLFIGLQQLAKSCLISAQKPWSQLDPLHVYLTWDMTHVQDDN